MTGILGFNEKMDSKVFDIKIPPIFMKTLVLGQSNARLVRES